MMVHAAAGGSLFGWPCGAYLTGEPYERVMMAMPADLGRRRRCLVHPEGRRR